jgi:hypothetical protein
MFVLVVFISRDCGNHFRLVDEGFLLGFLFSKFVSYVFSFICRTPVPLSFYFRDERAATICQQVDVRMKDSSDYLGVRVSRED